MALKRLRKLGWPRFTGSMNLRALIEQKRARQRPEIVSLEFTGKWVAWTSDGRKIVGAGDTASEARIAAEKAGVHNGLFEWIPKQEELRSMTCREVKTNS
jgi:hypothetical protein